MNKSRAWASICLLLIAVLAFTGCASTGSKGADAPVQRGPVPPYAQVAAAYNARVSRLERLACPVSVVVHTRNKEGNPLSEQVEGNLQMALPSSIALRLDKVGQTVFYLGSNQTTYWWFDLKDEKSALVGSHDKATPQAVADFGLPVHPLDLLECLAIEPLPDQPPRQARLAWTKDGHSLVLSMPGRWGGQRQLWLDPATYEPAKVVLMDKSGAIMASAKLAKYVDVDVSGDTRIHPRMASQFEVALPTQEATAVLTLVRPQNPGDAQRPKLFDVEALIKLYRIQKITDIDRPRDNQHAALNSGAAK
jgi:hypothetical protein